MEDNYDAIMKEISERFSARNKAELLDKSVRIPPKVIPGKYHDNFVCRRCGYGVYGADWNYCPNCGQAQLDGPCAGICGWKRTAADDKFAEILKDETDKIKTELPWLGSENKQEILDALLQTLQKTRDQYDLEDLQLQKERGEEHVIITYRGGYKDTVNTTLDSGVSMIRDVLRKLD